MTLQPVRIAKNTTYLTLAYIVQKVLSFLYFILIARLIGVEDIGKYVFALSFTSIFGIFIDIGLSSVLTREAAKDFSRAKEYLNNIITLKALLGAATYLVAIVAINLLGKEPLVREMVYISGIIMVLDSFYLSFYAVFRAYQNLKYEAVGIMVGQAIVVGSGAAVLLLHLPLQFLIGAILCGSIFNFFYAWIILSKKLKIKLSLGFNKEILKMLLAIAVPFALSGIFARVYGYIDTVLLSTIAGDKAVGWYSAGYKITFALQFVPMAFAAAIFPAMSNYFVTNKAQLAKVFEKSMYYLMIVAVPISFGVFTLAHEFITKMYGQSFAPTTIALQILIGSVIFNFLGFPLGSLLNACNRQKTNTVNMGITMVVNITMNAILIPLYGYVGAAIAALASGITLFVLGFYWAGKITPYNKLFLFKGFAKVLFAGLVMSAAILVLKPFVHFFFLVPIGGVVYLLSLLLLQGFNWEEIEEFYNSFRRKEGAIEVDQERV